MEEQQLWCGPYQELSGQLCSDTLQLGTAITASAAALNIASAQGKDDYEYDAVLDEPGLDMTDGGKGVRVNMVNISPTI